MDGSIERLQGLVKSGYSDWGALGEIAVKEEGGLLLFNYTAKAQYIGKWNWIEVISRGTIIEKGTGRLVGLGFPKFFNWMEGGRNTRASVVEATEKVDGSLGIMYYANGWKIATRGSFNSNQALWATEWLNTNCVELCKEWDPGITLLFEIVYPENRVVLDYGDRQELVLIGARDLRTHEDYLFFPHLVEWADRYGLTTPKFYAFNSWVAALEAREKLGYDAEGFVLRFSDGQRFKFKGDAYLEAHRLMTQMTYKHVLAAMRDGTLESILSVVPDEFHGDIHEHEERILGIISAAEKRIVSEFQEAPVIEGRKAFALWATENYRQDAPYLFAMLDGKPIRPMIYDIEFRDEGRWKT